MPENHAIEVSDLVKTYPKGPRALDGISFAVGPGTVFALLGPNGAGKSTTVKILTTLSSADSGRAVVAGHDVIRAPGSVRRAIGCVTQKTAVDPDATGRENLQLQGRLFGLRGAQLTTRTAELLDRFRLTEAAGRLARTYSGGMARKLDVAMGLVHRPQVLFLDEPTTGLDPEARVDMWAELQSLARTDALTILLTTHYLDEADKLADHVAIVDHGRIVAAGTPEQLKSELRGDALVIELGAPADAAVVRRALEAVAHEVAVDGRTVRARVDSGAVAVPRALSELDLAGLEVATITVARPSLDDVYLRHTGRAFTTPDAPSLAEAAR